MFTPTLDEQIQLKLSPTFEMRERYERRVDRDFRSNVNDNRSDAFSRVRGGFDWKLGTKWSGSVQLQYAHDAIWTLKKNFSTDFRDMTLGFVAYKTDTGTLTLGRQKIAIGSERLIGPLEWSNFSQVFDGVRFQTPQLDVFAFSVGLAVPNKYDARAVGANYKSNLGETLGVFKHDKTATGKTDVATIAHHWMRKAQKMSYDIEAAIQFGKQSGATVEAWAWHSRAAYQATPKVSIYGEVNAASGGNGTKVRTFDNLYPTNHKFYGSMDMQSWKNMNELEVGVEYKPKSDLDMKLHWHGLGLRDAKDGWYGALGGLNPRVGGTFIDATGASGREVGHEVDFDVTYRMDKQWTVMSGVGIFNPGRFVKALNGGVANTQLWGYLSVQFKF